MEKIKLSQWAKRHGVCYRTAYNYFKQGRFEGRCEVSDKGTIHIFEEKATEKLEDLVNAFVAAVKNLSK
jgi:predicted site-specific integrase-resolvase